MKRILLLLIMLLAVGTELTYAQTRTVTGRVLDENGQGLPGAAVGVKGTQIGAATDMDGNFSFEAPDKSIVLIVQSVGYQTQEVTVTDGAVTVRMKVASKELEGAVVTALAIKREKRELGYSATTLSNQDLTSGNNVSALSAIQGKTAGANITSSTGGPGGSTRVILRGEKSLGGNNNALMVVDGVIVNNTNRLSGVSNLSEIDFGNQGNDVNPEDIESITVLKGPAAAALYGSAGANGAIMITTKSGRGKKGPGKLEVTAQTKYTLSSVLKLPDFQNTYGQGNIYDGIADDRRENFSWGEKFDGQLRPWGQEINGHQLVKPYSAQPNNIKDFFNTGTTSENNVSLGSGDDKSSFYLSLNSLNNKGITPNTFYDRYGVRFNGSTQLNNKFYANVNFNYLNINSRVETQGQSANGQGAVWDNLLQTPRDIPVQELKNLSNPYYGYGFTDSTGVQRYGYYGAYAQNPYWVAEHYDNRNKVDRVLGAGTIGFKPNQNWNIFDRIGADIVADRVFSKIPKYTYLPFDVAYYSNPDGSPQTSTNNGGYFESNTNNMQFNNDLIIDFNKDLSKDFNLDVTAGNNVRINQINFLSSNIDPNTNGLVIPEYYNFGNATSPVVTTNTLTRSRLVSLYGSAVLGFKKQLFLSLTGRNDWASTLNMSNWSFFYPSANLSWVFTEAIKSDNFKKILNYGKIRGGFAAVGNAPAAYANNSAGYTSTTSSTAFGSVVFPFAGIPGYSLGDVTVDPNLKPEATSSWELGTELAFLKNRISLDFTYYSSNTTNQIVTIPIAPSSGYTAKTINVGNITNKGVEIAARVTPVKSRTGWTWELFGTYTKNQNKVVSLNAGTTQISIGGLSGMTATATVGQPYGAFYAIDNQTDAQGRTIVDSASGMPKPTANTVFKGTYQPKFIASWGTNLTYKGFTLNVLFTTKQGGYFFSATKDLMDFVGTAKETENRDPYVFPNSVYINSNGQSVVNTTKFSPYNYYTNVIPAGQHIIDASYVKLQEASLYYSIPDKMLKRTPFGKLSLGIYGNNLFIWTAKDNKYVDPEVNSAGASNLQGFDFRARPSLRNYGITLKLTF